MLILKQTRGMLTARRSINISLEADHIECSISSARYRRDSKRQFDRRTSAVAVDSQ